MGEEKVQLFYGKRMKEVFKLNIFINFFIFNFFRSFYYFIKNIIIIIIINFVMHNKSLLYRN